jgi:hypothetical protein
MIEPHPSPPELIVLHSLRCAGAASTERLSALVGPGIADDVEDLLLTLAVRGLVTHATGAFGGWGLTDDGRRADAEQIAAELDRAGVRRDVEDAYRDFLELNQDVLDICGAWQLRSTVGTMVLNDHSDPAYDADVLARLATTDARAQPICRELAGRLRRFGGYGPRLATALHRAEHGERDLVTTSLDSYHSVWFVLHEDLLATLGLARGS